MATVFSSPACWLAATDRSHPQSPTPFRFLFAFYGLMMGVVVVGQLQSAGFLLGFKWHDGTLLMAMMVLLLTGMGWSKLRYR